MTLLNAHYRKTLSYCKPLTAEEELECAILVKEGCSKARARMINTNLRLATSIAMHYIGKGVDLDDVVQEANIGLMRAVDRFEPSRGIRFSTYAFFWIQESIERFLVNTAETIRIPVCLTQDLNKMRKAFNAIVERNDDFSIELLAERSGFSVEKVRKNLSLINGFSFVETLEIDFAYQEQDIMAALTDDAISITIGKWMSGLPDTERYIITRRFGLDDKRCSSMAEISKSLNLTPDKVRRHINKLFDNFKSYAQTQGVALDEIR